MSGRFWNEATLKPRAPTHPLSCTIIGIASDHGTIPAASAVAVDFGIRVDDVFANLVDRCERVACVALNFPARAGACR